MTGTTDEILDIPRLVDWLDLMGLEPGQPLWVVPLDAGRTNAMFRLNRGDRRWVLRRPARVAIARANDLMRREYQFLNALSSTEIPHPKVVGLCNDHEVLGCTFYVMEEIEGVHPFPVPPAFDDDMGRRAIAFALVDALAQLHGVDWRAAGLEGIGHPEGFHERQVTKWSTQLVSYGGRDISGTALVADWLERQPPPAFDPSIMHGDYHGLNLLVGPDPPARVTGILDWETATIGDPLLDLVGFCEIWCAAATDGWPTREELIARYCNIRDLSPVGDLRYYEVLYRFRLAVLLEGIYQRSLRDPSLPDRIELAGMAERTIADAVRAIS